MKMFYDQEKNDIRDKEMFRRRIMGMVSYYSSPPKDLVPSINKKEILHIPMSDYQFDKYSIIRKNEIDRDKNSKKQKGKAKVIKGKNSKTNENSKGDKYLKLILI